MYKSLLCSILFLLSIAAQADPVRIAIIDTGLNLKDERFKSSLCKDGHRDFTEKGLIDHEGHGTHVAGLIRRQLKGLEGKYCFVIIKYYDSERDTFTRALIHAMSYVKLINVQFVNISSGGDGFKMGEENAIRHNPSVTWIIAAGNDSKNLDEHCDTYPACYEFTNIMIVGNLKDKHIRNES